MRSHRPRVYLLTAVIVQFSRETLIFITRPVRSMNAHRMMHLKHIVGRKWNMYWRKSPPVFCPVVKFKSFNPQSRQQGHRGKKDC